ncbi:MAG: hypothetical protein FWF83_00705 [Clostridiales bacterium]|nr:hypothetical protein [Clostridiales bacterium]
MGVLRAAMDIGTNSCRLVIVETEEGHEKTLVRIVRMTRLGEGIGQGGLLIKQEAMDRTLAALVEFQKVIGAYPVGKTWLMGTQALREAGNSQDFAAEVKERTGFDLEIISGEREAYLSYVGAAKAFAGTAFSQPYVLDIGAGSTELFYEGNAIDPKRQVHGASAPIGSLRLMEKPMDSDGIFGVLNEYWAGIAANIEANSKKPLVAVGGTATTLGAIYLHMEEYDPEALLGLQIDKHSIQEVIGLLESMTPQARLTLPGMLPGREDVMHWGLRIMLEVMRFCRQKQVAICDRDLLFGVMDSE